MANMKVGKITFAGSKFDWDIAERLLNYGNPIKIKPRNKLKKKKHEVNRAKSRAYDKNS